MAKHLSLTPCHVANVHQTLPDQAVPQVEGPDQMLNGLDRPLTVRMVHLGCGRGLPTIGTAQRMQTNVATGVVTWIAVSAGRSIICPRPTTAQGSGRGGAVSGTGGERT